MKKIYYYISIVSLFVFCGAMYKIFYDEEKEAAIDEWNERHKIYIEQAAKGFNSLFELWQMRLHTLSARLDIIDINEEGKKSLRIIHGQQKNQIKALTRVDRFGRITYTEPHNPQLISADISYQKHVKEVLKTHKMVISDLFYAVQGYFTIAIHVPVFKNGQFDGTVAVLLDFKEVAKGFLADIKIGESGYPWVLSKEGIELYCAVESHIGKSVLETSKNYPSKFALARKVLAGYEGTGEYYFDRAGDNYEVVKFRAVYKPLRFGNTFWSIIIAEPENEILSSLVSFKNKLLLVFGIFFIGGAVFAFYGFKAYEILIKEEARKITDKALRESEARLNKMIRNSSDVIVLADETGKHIFVSEAIETITGFKRDVLAEDPFKYIHPDDVEHIHNVWKLILATPEKPFRVEYRHLNKKGSYIWLEAVAQNYLSDPLVKAVIINVRDIDERKKKEQKLQNKTDELNRFIYMISHDLKSPLVTIKAFLGFLEEDLMQADSESVAKDLDYIHKASDKMAFLLSELLEFSRVGKFVNAPTVFPLQKIIEEVTSILAGAIIQKKVKLIVTETPVIINGDYQRIVTVFQNLIDNSIKYSGKKVPVIEIGVFEKDCDVVLFVKDNGSGFEQQYHDKLFGLFEKLHPESEGAGVGLALVKKIIEIHGGRIWAQSDGPGCGATFYFTLKNLKIEQKHAIESDN